MEENEISIKKSYIISKYLCLYVYLFIGFVVFIIGFVFTCKYFYYEVKGLDATAEVTSINEEIVDDEGNKTYYIHVKYEVDGKLYKNVYNTGDRGFYEGKKINIHYLKSNPAKSEIELTMVERILFPIMAVVGISVGIVGIVKYKRGTIAGKEPEIYEIYDENAMR